MELNGEVVMNALREQVWAALNDAVVLQACIPGCEEVADESDTVRKVRIMVKMGPVRARFNGKVTLSEVLAPERCVLGFEGSGGAAGMASGRSQVTLIADGDTTRLTYTVKASVGGKLGQIGGRMMDASAKQLADQFFAALREHLAPKSVPISLASTLPGEAVTGDTSAQDSPSKTPDLIATPAYKTSTTGTFDTKNTPPTLGEASRVLWFLMGAASTGFGVWLGAHFLR